tara:strand:+ start:3717 stop:3971 length:255 start_codon:yes stop_codon:yes gene_type:complete
MFSFYHLFIKVDCPYCREAIDELEEAREKYVVTVIDKCHEYLGMVKKQFGHTTVPVILQCKSDGTMDLVGGCKELLELLESQRK